MSTRSGEGSSTTRIASRFRSAHEAVEHFKRHERIKPYDMQASRVQSVSWNVDGTKIAVGSVDRVVSAGSVDAACRIKVTFAGVGHNDSVDAVAFHRSNPNLLASASSDRTIRVWDVRNSKTHTKLGTRAANLYVSWSPCGKFLVYGDKDDRLHVVDSRSLQQLLDELNDSIFDSTGQYLFVTTGQGKVDIFSMPDMKPVRSLQAHSSQSACKTIAMSPDGERFAVGATDAICTIWNTDELICERAISRLDYPLRTISFSHDSRLLAMGSEDHVIDIAYVDDGSRVYELKVEAETYSVAWHPRYHILAFATGAAADARDRDLQSIKLFGFLQ